MEKYYLNYYITAKGDIVCKFVCNRFATINSQWTLLFTFVYNEDLKMLQEYSRYISYINSWKKKHFNKLNLVNKVLKFIIDL